MSKRGKRKLKTKETAVQKITPSKPTELKIYKVQMPLYTGDPEMLALVYNEDRTQDFYVPTTSELVELMGGQPKKFFWGIDQDGDFNIVEEAPWQDW